MFEPGQTRQLMRQFGIRADKSLGQNFLIEQAALEKILLAGNVHNEDVVLEIGAGLGVLTCALAARARHVIAIEFDNRLLPALEYTTLAFDNVHLVHGDVLSLNLDTLTEGRMYKVVANIPYNITSRLIRHLMETAHPAELVVLTIQREVAQRIVAGPGEMSLLALSVQIYGSPRIAAKIPAGSFYPRPSVDSSVIQIHVDKGNALSDQEMETLFTLARAGFGQRRKQLKNALSHGLGWGEEKTLKTLMQAGIDPTARAQALEVEKWLDLTRVVLLGMGM